MEKLIMLSRFYSRFFIFFTYHQGMARVEGEPIHD